MATTTNYGWTTPDDTALVKDGASAIRTLGSSVDTTTKNLNPSTTLGDIEYRSSTANTNTRLGIGTTGQVLSVVGGVPAWASAGGGLALVQRSTFSNVAGTSTTFDGVFTSTYVSYLVEIENLGSAVDTDDLQIVLRASALDVTGHYGNSIVVGYTGSTFTSTSSSNVNQLTIYAERAGTTFGASGQIFFNNIGQQSKYGSLNGSLFGTQSASYALFFGNADSASIATGFRLKSASSNISGTVAVYGLAK